MTSTTSIGWALVGAGIMGRRMLQRLSVDSEICLRSIYDPFPNPSGLPDIAFSSTIEEAATAPGIDVVYISSPPHAHREAVEKAAAVGKNIFCEKPLAAHLEDIEELEQLAAAHQNDLRMAVNFPFAYSACVQQLVDATGGTDFALSNLDHAHIRLRFRTWPRPWQQNAAAWLTDPAAGGGFAREVLSHFLFLAQRVLGRLNFTDVHTTKDERGAETSIIAHGFAGDVRLSIDAAIGGDKDDDNCFELHSRTPSTARDGGRVLALRNWINLDRDGEWSTPESDTAQVSVALRSWLSTPLSTSSSDPAPVWRLATFAEAAHVARTVEALLAAGP